MILYGTDARGRVGVRFLNGVSPGTSPAKPIASTFENEPSGAFSLILMSPVLSSATMPEMSAFGLPFLTYSSAPTIPRKNAAAAGLQVEHALDRVLEVRRP